VSASAGGGYGNWTTSKGFSLLGHKVQHFTSLESPRFGDGAGWRRRPWKQFAESSLSKLVGITRFKDLLLQVFLIRFLLKRRYTYLKK
jgi:hypothetical protein